MVQFFRSVRYYTSNTIHTDCVNAAEMSNNWFWIESKIDLVFAAELRPSLICRQARSILHHFLHFADGAWGQQSFSKPRLHVLNVKTLNPNTVEGTQCQTEDLWKQSSSLDSLGLLPLLWSKQNQAPCLLQTLHQRKNKSCYSPLRA